MSAFSAVPGKLEPCELRVGVFGGTFDPIHIGHLIIAEEARARLDLHRVVFVPARVSPLKLQGTFISAEDRWRMVQLAIEGNPHFCLSRADLSREGPSFTIDTLQAVRGEYGRKTQLFFIMGTDSLGNIQAWHRPQEIIRLARIVAVSRPGFHVDFGALEKQVPGIRQATEVIEELNIGISSTDIRARLRKGLPIKYQVPASVEAYIYEHCLPGHHLARELGD